LAYPAMLTYLPNGLLGLVLASLIAAFMSTISTHLNWGASYLTNDVYKRFVNKDATEKQLVNLGRIATVFLMILAAVVATFLETAKEAFDIILLIGAGTGLIFVQAGSQLSNRQKRQDYLMIKKKIKANYHSKYFVCLSDALRSTVPYLLLDIGFMAIRLRRLFRR